MTNSKPYDVRRNLNQLRDEAHQIAVEHGFTEAGVLDDLMLMVSETAEALEDHRARHAPNEIWYVERKTIQNDRGCPVHQHLTIDGSCSCPVSQKPCGIPSEIADVVIRGLHFCGKHGIDIQQAVDELAQHRETNAFDYKEKTVPIDTMRMVGDLSKAADDHDLGFTPTFVAYRDKSRCLHKEQGPALEREPIGIPMRMASVLLRCLRFARRYDIDLDHAVEEKQTFNRSRSFRHGNKRL